MEENVIGMPDSFFERLNKKNGFADDTTAAPVDSGTTPVATDKTIPSGMPDSFFEKLNSQQHYADTNNWAENYKRYIPQAEENPSAWDNIKNNFFAIKDASEASMYGGLELMSQQGEKSGNANFANFIKAAGMYYGADPNWLVKNMQENEAQSQEELKRVWLDPKMGQFNATDMFADPKSFFQTQLPQMLGGSATLMAAGMGIAKGVQTGVMAIGAAGAPFTFGGSAVAAGFIGGAVASAISRPIESLMEGYGAFDEAYSELAKKYPNATHQQLTDMAMPVFNKTFDENMQLQVLDAVQLGLSIIPVTAWGKGSLSGTGAIGRMARRADMMRQRYNVAAHIGETAFQMGTEGWEEGRQMQITNEAINKYVGTDKPTSWYDMLNTKEGQSAVSGGAFMGGMMESPGILKLAYNKLTGVGDDIKTKPYEDIKQKQTALFYGNIAKSVNEGTTNEMMQAINKFGRSGVLATVETDDADSRNKSSIAEAKRLGDEVAEQVGVFSRMKEQYHDVSEKGLVRMFQNNALIRNNANALKTLSEDNVTDAPIIQRINAQNEALNKENNDIIAGKDVWETPSHEDPFAGPEKDKEADIPFDSVEEVEAARLKEIEALQQIPTDGMTDEQMYQRAESLAEINSRYEDLKNRLTEKINDAKGHYENQRVLTEMLQNNIPVEGTIQKAYGMHYDFVTQDGKTVRFYNQATHDVVDDNDFNGSAFLVLRKAEQGLDGTYKDEKGNYLFRSVLGDKDHAERIEVHTTDKDGNDKYLGNVAVSNAEDYNIARDRAKAARMEKLEGEDGEGEGFSVSDEQLSGVKTTSNEQAAEAQSYGFRNAYHALNSVNKYFDADYTDYANIPKEDLALVGRIKQEEAASATTTTPPPDSPPDSPPPSEPDTPPAPPTPPPTPPPAPQSPSPASAPSGTTSSTDSGNAGYERTERSFDKVNVGDNITHNGKQGKVFAKVRPKGSLSHPVVLAKDAEGKVFRVTESEYKGTERGESDNVLKTNGKLVSYRNDIGRIVIDEENNVIFEGNKSSVELGKTTDEEFAAKSIGDIGISYVNENSLNQAILVDNTVYVKGEQQELVRINYDKNGNVVSYTYKNSKGQERTNRNYEAALDVAIQKNNQEFDKSRKGASDEVKQRDEEHISGVVKAEYGDSIGYILETMPDEVYDTFGLMEAGVTRLEKDAVQDMVLRTLDALADARKRIEGSNATKKEKGSALSMIEKFEKDLNKYYGKLDKQSKVSAKDVAKANTGENNKGVNTVQDAEQKTEAYHADKAAGKETELVKAVEDLINKNESNRNTTTEVSPKAGVSSNSNEGNSALRDVEAQKADIERRRQEELNQQTDAGYSTIALDYLFTGGRDVMLSTDYLLQALVGGFTSAAKEINDIRNKYANKLGNIRDDINSDVYNQMMGEIRNVISKTYNDSKANEIFDKILKNATGFTNREGNQISIELDKLNEQNESKINAKYDAEYIDAVKKGKMTKEQAMKALEEVGRKDSKAYAELATLEETSGVSGSALKDVGSTTKALDKLANDSPDIHSKLEEQAGVMYHGTEADFEKFDRVGDKIPSLGLGYYFTPTLEKAKQYGSKIKKIVLEGAKTLNWNKLSDTEREQIKKRLEERMPKSVLGGLGKRNEKTFNVKTQREESLDFFHKKQEETANYEYERGKARVKRDGDNVIISWSDEGLGNVNDAELLNFAQQYDNNIGIEMGYDAAKYGNEIAVFNGDKIKNATNQVIAEAYHKAKKDGSNPELVKAVEDLLGKAPTQYTEAATPAKKESGGVSGSALKDVARQESDAEKLNKEAGVDIYVARQDIDTNGGEYTLSQVKENGNTNTFLIEDAKGNEVGKAQLSANGNYLENIRIDEKHRRKGLASKVYDFIELRKGIELEPSPNKQSKEAKALWDKRNLQKSVSNKANGGLLAKALGESMSKTFADFRNKQQVLLELENKYFEQKGLSKEEFNKLSENEKSEIIKDAIKWKNDNPELVKAVEEALSKPNTNVTTPTKEVSTSENKIKSWIDKWEELKKENDNEQLDLFYNKVKVALNGYAQGKGVVDEFTKLKSEIEQFAKERKAKTKEQGNKERVSSNSNEGNSALRDVESNEGNKRSSVGGESNSIKYQIEENRDEPLSSVNPALAEYIRQRMQRLFPSVALFSDKASFEAAAKKVSKGVTFSSAYIGAAIKNMVYVDAEKALQHTEIHEYAHIYWDALPADHPLKTSLLDKFGGNEEAAIDAIGRAGTIIMENELDIAKSGFFEKWLKKFWAAVKGVFTSKSIEQAFAERLLTNADEVTEENITSGVVKYMKMKSSAKYSELSEKAVKGIEKIIGKKISSLTFPEYYKHISTEIKPNDFKQWKMLSPQKFLEKMYGIVSPVSTLSPSNKAVFMKQYREYLDDYNWAENNVWTRFASGSMTLTVKEIEDLYMEAYKRKSYGTKDAVNFLADLYSKAVMYKNMQQEIKGDTFNKPFAKMSFDMMSGHEITDLSGSEFVSGKYSLLSPDRVKETILQGREKLYREVQRNATIKEDALKNDFDAIWKRVKDLKSDLRKIVDKTGTYFIDRNSSAYKALRGGTAADRALADLLDMHYKYESAYGGLSMEKGKYRVPVARMDFGGLAKKFGFKEGMRRYFAKPSKYDNVIIDVRSLGLSKPLMTLKQARQEMVKGSNAIYPFQMLKLTKKVDALTKEAYKQFNSGRHANGDIVTTEDLSGSRYGVSFVKDDESSEDLKVSMMLYHYANIENESYDLLSPYSMYIQKYLGRKDKPNMLKWVKMLDDDLIKGESPTSNLGVYAKYVQALTNYTHWLQLGFNIAGMPFNAFAGFAQSVREIGFRNTLRGLRRVIGSLTVGGGAGVVNAKAISIMEKLHIVSLPKDLEMSVTSKIGKGISKIAFLPVSFVEYINHAYSFIGAMDESEWERLKALPANASAEDYTKAMGGNERVDELHTLTQKINGAYSKYSRRGINKTAEGRALMQFKNWLPDVIFAHLTVSQLNEAGEDLYGEYQSGIATSIKNTVWNKTIIPMFKDKSIAQAKKNWETLSEHEQMQVGKAMRQLVILGGMALWIASLDDRDDKELKRMLRRAMGDVTYIFDVSNMQFLFDNTVPVFGTIKNLLGLVAEVFSTATGNPSVYEKRQGSHMRGDLKLPVMIENQTPVVNKISKLVNEGD